MNTRLAAQANQVVLVVDDVTANRDLFEGYLEDLGYAVRQASDGVEALAAVEASEPDLVLLDIDMPRLDGLEVCRRLKAHPRYRLIPIVLLTASHDRGTRVAGIAAGADDFLTKPFDANELLVRAKVLLRDRALNIRLDASDSVLRAFARAVEARDRFTIYHAERVGMYSREMGRTIGITGDDLDVLYEGGVLHDLGKIAIPDAVLQKPGPLTEAEFAIVRTHSIIGERICAPLRSTRLFLPILRHHHERVDGTGYPDRLLGDAIPLGARIAAIADSWDAMVSDRPYRPQLDQEVALQILRDGAGHQWDAELVEAFLHEFDHGLIERVAEGQLGAA